VGWGTQCRGASRDIAWALGLTLVYAAIVILRRHGDWAFGLAPFKSSSVFYNAPVVAPLFLFLQERTRRRAEIGRRRILIDAAVLGLAASRMVIPVPHVSGHALLLAHGLGTTRGLVPRVALALVLLATAFVKIVLWHDPSLVGGLVLGAASAWLWQRSDEARDR
jgi:hypothetical protein